MRTFLLALAFASFLAGPAVAQTIDASAIERVGLADANGDGVVARAEFIAYRSSQFDRMDRNGDGALSSSDAPRFAGWSPMGSQVREMIAVFDANNDGRVSRAELQAGPTLAFDRADQNNDAVVTDTEIRTAAAAAR